MAPHSMLASWFASVVEQLETHLVPEVIREDADRSMRARILVLASVFALVVVVGMRFMQWRLYPDEWEALLTLTLWNFALVIPILALLITKSLRTSTVMFCVVVVLQVGLGIIGEGGLDAVMLFYLPVVPLLMGFVASSRMLWLSCLAIIGILLWTTWEMMAGGAFISPLTPSIAHRGMAAAAAIVMGGIFATFIHGAMRRTMSALERELVERDQLEDELRTSTREANAANAAKDGFLAYVSHEIRNPLTAMLGALELMKADKSEPNPHTDVLESSGQTLLRLVNRLLDLSKLQAGHVELEVGPVNLRLLGDEMVASTQARTASAPVVVECHVAPDLPEEVGIDGTRLRQLLSNLLSNAAKHTAEGTIRLEFSRARDRDGSPLLMLLVENTGAGIPEESQNLIFERFRQVQNTGPAQTLGTGLGLSIVREIVGLMGGSISLRSELGSGTVVLVMLPLIPAPPGVLTAEEAPVSKPPVGRVLLADDEEANRVIVGAMLERLGQHVVTAADGAAAVSRIREGGIDLVLMDLRMPVLDGVSAARAARAAESEEGGTRVPIVALTANTQSVDLEEMMAAGIDGVLSKPVSGDELARTLNHWIGSVPNEIVSG